MDKDWTELHTCGYLLKDSILMFVLNDKKKTYRNVKVGVNLDMWIPGNPGKGSIRIFDITGEQVFADEIKGSIFKHTFPSIKSSELYVVEIHMT